MKKLIRYVPVIAVIIVIFVLTLQTREETTALSHAFRGWLIKVSSKIGIDTEGVWWNSEEAVRRLGHVIEYFALGAASGMAFEKKSMTIVFGIAVSVIDQITKVFVPIRHFDIIDIPFDMLGFICGSVIVWIIKDIIRK